MSRSSFSTPPCSMHEIDRAAQFLVRRQDRLVLADLHSEHPQHPARETPRSPISIGPSIATTNCIGRATSKRAAIRRVEGRGFRNDLGKDHDHDRHDHGRVNHADIAEPRQQNAGRERGRRDIHRIVAEQDARRAGARARREAVDDLRARCCRAFPAAPCAARDDAVSAVSLAEKNADSSRQTTTMPSAIQSSCVIALRVYRTGIRGCRRDRHSRR